MLSGLIGAAKTLHGERAHEDSLLHSRSGVSGSASGDGAALGAFDGCSNEGDHPKLLFVVRRVILLLVSLFRSLFHIFPLIFLVNVYVPRKLVKDATSAARGTLRLLRPSCFSYWAEWLLHASWSFCQSMLLPAIPRRFAWLPRRCHEHWLLTWPSSSYRPTWPSLGRSRWLGWSALAGPHMRRRWF
jgi:hypothetical protein